MKELPRILAFTAVAVALALALLEGGLRILGDPPQAAAPPPSVMPGPLPDHYLADPLLGWVHRPGTIIDDPVYRDWMRQWGKAPMEDRTPVNSRGMRDTEPADPRPGGQLRIMALGDSSVFGVGAPRRSTFAERLEVTLAPGWVADAAARPVEVFNGGVSGYSSFQSLIQLERNLDLGLDAVLFYNQNSDMMDARGVTDSQFYGGPAAQLASHPLRRLALWRWLSRGISALRPAPTAPASGDNQLRVRVEDYAANLERLLALAGDEGFKVVLIIPPVTSDVVHPEPPETYQVRSEAAAQRVEAELARVAAATDWWEQQRKHYRMAMALAGYRAGVPVVDGPAVFTEAWLSDYVRYEGAGALFVDELHPSAEGHRLLAEAILPELRACLGVAPSR